MGGLTDGSIVDWVAVIVVQLTQCADKHLHQRLQILDKLLFQGGLELSEPGAPCQFGGCQLVTTYPVGGGQGEHRGSQGYSALLSLVEQHQPQGRETAVLQGYVEYVLAVLVVEEGVCSFGQ